MAEREGHRPDRRPGALPPAPRRAFALVLTATAALTLLGVAATPSGRVAVIAATQVLGTAAVVAAVRRYRPGRPGVWFSLLAAAWAYSLAWYAVLLDAGPVAVAVLCLAAYTAMGRVVVLITRQADSLPGIDRLDVALLAISASAASLHLTGALDGATGTTESWVAAQAAGTVVFAATAVWAVVTGRSSAPAVRLLLGVAGGLVVWHLVTLGVALTGTYRPGSRVDVLVVPGWGALAAAAWQPSMRALGRPTASSDHSFPGSLAVLAAGLTLGVLPLVSQLSGRPVAPWVLVAGTTSTVALLLAREVLVARRATSLADGDPLTGLGNRRSLLRHLSARAGDPRSPQALLCVLDLDAFQDVNDSRGSAAGDRVLAEVGRRLAALAALAGDGASAYRLGGDEFAVLVPLADAAAADGLGRSGTSATAERLLAAVAEPVGSRDGAVRLRARVGEVLLPPGTALDPTAPDGDDASTAFAAATAALAEAELALAEAGRRRVRAVRATEGLLSAHRCARALSEALPGALRTGQLVPHYEPLVQLGADAAADRVLGLEALVRWQHPELGLLGADRVVPVAEQRGLLPAVDSAVLRAALADCARWRADVPGWADLSVAVNASAPSLVHEDLVESVLAELARAGLPGRALTLEITEQALLADRTGIAARLLELRRAGVRIAADDFGTGFASLDYLISFPLDLLKVDRSLVERAADPAGRRLLAGVVEVSHALGVAVLAEGVSCATDVELARELGFDAVQGFGVGRAAPAERVPTGPERASLLP